MIKNIIKQDIFSPTILFPIGFIFYFGFGSLNIIQWGYVPAINWLYYILALLSYYMGNVIAIIIWKKSKQFYNVGNSKYEWRRTFPFVIAMLSLVSFATVLISWRKTGIPILSNEVDVTRVQASTNGYLIVIFLSIKAYFVLLYLYLRTNTNAATAATKYLVYTNMFLIVLALLGTANRGHIVTVMLTCLFVYIYTETEKISFKKMLIVVISAAALLLVFTVIGYIRYLTMYNGGFLVDIISAYDYPPSLLLLAPLYLYIRNGPKMFNDVLEAMHNHDFTFGRLHLAPIVAPLQAKLESADMVIKKMLGMEFEGYGVAATLLSSFYIEFGVVGIFIGMLIAGVTIQHLYRKMLFDGQPANVGVYAFFMMNLIMALYGNILSSFNVIWTPFLIYFLSRYFVVSKHHSCERI